MFFHSIVLLAAMLPNLFSPAQLTAAENTGVEISGQVTLIVSPFYADDVGFYWKRLFNQRYCSAVVVWSKGTHEIVATARHCTHPDVVMNPFSGDELGVVVLTPQRIRFANGDVGKVNAYYESTTADVSILDVTSMRNEPYQFMSTQQVYKGEPLMDFGMPDAFAFTANLAVVSQGPVAWGIQEQDPDQKKMNNDLLWNNDFMVQCTGCAPGSSGSALTDPWGRVAGLMVAGGEFEEWVVPSEYVGGTLKTFADHPELHLKTYAPDYYEVCYIGPDYCTVFGDYSTNVKEGDLPQPANADTESSNSKTYLKTYLNKNWGI